MDYRIITENGLKIDLTRGIDPYIGTDGVVVTRNKNSFKLSNGIPGTGIFTHAKNAKSDTLVMFFIAVMFVLGFGVLLLAAVNADFSISKFFATFLSTRNIVYIVLFIAINSGAVLTVYKYKKILYRRYLSYQDKLSDECSLVTKAMESEDAMKYEILSHYRSCLEIEKEMVEVETILSSLELYTGSTYTAEKEIYAERFENLTKKLTETRFQADNLNEEDKAKYHSLCECFEILFTGARFWDISSVKNPFSARRHPWTSTELGTGTFDYILSCSYPPIIKTSKGTLIIYSDYMILSRSTVDFDIYPLKSVHMEFNPVPGHSQYGYMTIPEIGLAITTSDPLDMEIFVKSFEAFKAGTYNPTNFKQLDSLLEEVSLYYITRRKVTKEMIQRHFEIGRGRTRRIMNQLFELGIISEENSDGMREIEIWDIEKVRKIIEENRQA